MAFLIKIKYLKQAIFALFLIFCFTILLACPVLATEEPATTPTPQPGDTAAGQALDILDKTAIEAKIRSENQQAPSAYEIVGDIINIVLSFLGVVFLLLIVYGGITWMRGGTVVGGGATKVDINKAKQIITQAIFGLTIVLLAYLITNFIIFRLIEVSALPTGQ